MFCKLGVEGCFFKFLFQSNICTTKNSDDPVSLHILTASHNHEIAFGTCYCRSEAR